MPSFCLCQRACMSLRTGHMGEFSLSLSLSRCPLHLFLIFFVSYSASLRAFDKPERHPSRPVPRTCGSSIQLHLALGDRVHRPVDDRGRPGGVSHARVHLGLPGSHQRNLRARDGRHLAVERQLRGQRGLDRQLCLHWVGQHGLHTRPGRRGGVL